MTTARDLLRHSSLIVTSRYAHMFEGGLDGIGARLPSLNAVFCDHALGGGKEETRKVLNY